MNIFLIISNNNNNNNNNNNFLCVLLTYWSSRDFLLVFRVNLMEFMPNARNRVICSTTTTCEVHTFKNKNKRKSVGEIFVYHFFLFYIECVNWSICAPNFLRLFSLHWHKFPRHVASCLWRGLWRKQVCTN